MLFKTSKYIKSGIELPLQLTTPPMPKVKPPKKENKLGLSENVLCFLKIIDKRWKYITMNKDGSVNLHADKPYRNYILNIWFSDHMMKFHYFQEHLFQGDLFNFVSWDDEKPFCIDEHINR